ncbi:hypothetical protein GCM10010193_07600 [Kitasatospora atroaurantiaca]|uniref:Uncharacterized protein n=1 Tax=Kitasatospora atroaurantiaca TaxID=285545 RepID=A0A561EJD5_9ACTN|nr:hypothetical protein [Kitasatospora atroaurantiaca]TWE15721.1 hypothetical protein FB465_0647 [Kitasatospora atroaurantiaca]
MSSDENFEQRMPDAMSHAVAQFAPPPSDLVLRATARGRRLRRARNAQLGAAAVLVAGGLFVGLGVLGPYTATTSKANPAAPPSPSLTPFADPSKIGSTAYRKDLLVSMMPKRGTVSEASDNLSNVRLSYVDGHGQSMVELRIEDGMTSSLAGHMACQDVHQANTGCRAETRPDGTLVQITEKGTLPEGHIDEWRVDTLRPNGRRVVVTASNTAPAVGPQSWPTPVPSREELKAVALDPRWDR